MENGETYRTHSSDVLCR